MAHSTLSLAPPPTPPTPPAPANSSTLNHRFVPFVNPTRLLPRPHLNLHSPSSLRLRCCDPSASVTRIDEVEKEEEERMVREAIAEMLQEWGATEEESEEIVAKAAKYARMLRDEVRELDELSLWKSWMMERGEEGIEEMEELSLKRKVRLLAREKGDGGKIACLESIGLSLGFATRIARALSKQTLKGLIRRVKYMKKIFFSGSDDQKIIGKRARYMMLHLSIPVHEDLQLTLSFFEKLEARRGGLHMLGCGDASFSVLVESFPGILSLPLETTITRLFELLEDIGVPRQGFRNILLLYPPIVFLDLKKEIKPRIDIFHKIDKLRDNIGWMLYKYPWILSASILENFVEVVSYLKAYKVPRACIYRAIMRLPHILGCSSSKFKPMINQIHKFEVKGKKLGKVIVGRPRLLLFDPKKFSEVVAFLQDLGIDKEGIRKILIRRPEIFTTRIDETLQRKVDYLKHIGINERHVPRVFTCFPEAFLRNIDTVVPATLDYLRSIGFSKKDIISMIRGFPPILGYNPETVLKPKLEFLLNIMGKSPSDVVAYPRYFSYSLEERIKPRFYVLKGRKISSSLKDMYGKNDEEFATEYLDIVRMLIPPS